MAALVVDVLFRRKVLESVPMRGMSLRIGRMPENDVVLDNLGVSRFHARLVLEDGTVFLEDQGSGNGTLVDGRRVDGRAAVPFGAPIAIGKHELRVRHAIEGEAGARKPARRRSDAIDPSRTYLLDAPQVPIVPPQPEPAEEPVAMASSPTPPSAHTPSPELDFDFVGALAESDEANGPATVPLEPSAAAPEAPLHAGFIVQRQGKLERVVAWSGDTLVAGRSGDCDIVLAQDEVSRRHVRFERIGERYEMVDLGSVNGSFVNCRRVDRQALSVGDVVQVEGFQLTFVLDRDPLDAAIAAKPIAQPARREDTFAMTMLQEEMPHRPGFTKVEEVTVAPAAEPEPIAEADLLPDDIEEIEPLDADAEKQVDATELRGSSRATSVQDLRRASQPNVASPEVCFEVRVRVDLLPPALRRAFEESGTSDLVIPAELRLKSS
jgi:pSer/pThr/pTyr-binding forkhead associated (FHA) protein